VRLSFLVFSVEGGVLRGGPDRNMSISSILKTSYLTTGGMEAVGRDGQT
jgi:hypothetical protein